jgi:hypothetical protein
MSHINGRRIDVFEEPIGSIVRVETTRMEAEVSACVCARERDI